MKILFAAIGSYGDINPYLALAKELKRRGHAPVMATARFYQDAIEKHGIGFTPLRPEAKVDDVELVRHIIHRSRGSERVIREFVMPAVRDMMQDLEKPMAEADMVISHMLTVAVPVLAEKTGKRWLSTVLAPLSFFSRYDVPVFPPAPWLAGLTRPLGPGFNGWLIKQLLKISYPWSEPIRDLRRELGLSIGGDPLSAGQHSPHGVLALFSKYFAPPQPDWPPNTVACGFPFLDELTAPLENELSDFLNAGDPPIVFTLGSSAVMVAGDFYEQAVKTVERLGRRAVLVAGPQAGDLAKTLPRSIKAVGWAAFPALFDRAAAVVHQGGVGTTAQALRVGKPQLVVPFAHDQFDNADHVGRLGLGEVLYRERVTVNRLEKKLRMILNDSAAAAAAKKMGERIRSENGVATACDEIEKRFIG